jgi:hypothetical protein
MLYFAGGYGSCTEVVWGPERFSKFLKRASMEDEV